MVEKPLAPHYFQQDGCSMPTAYSFPPPDAEMAALGYRTRVFGVSADSAGERLDRFLARVTGLSRGRARALIDFGAVWIGALVRRKQSLELAAGDEVTLHVPLYGPVHFYEADPGRILFEDRHLLAYDKEAGIPSQQTPYDGYNHAFGALGRLKAGEYLALHHRLDAPTSGVLLLAKDRTANLGLGRMFEQGGMEKTYLAVVAGRPAAESFEVDRPVSKRAGEYYCPEDGRGKPARTLFRVIGPAGGPEGEWTLIEARPLTGRTHQIRLHLTAAGLPILGDLAHGGRPYGRLMLHAAKLAFNHPVTSKRVELIAPTPEGF
jgi:23S rRNA pseudouridine1911/1915/1917 synthase